MHVSLQKKSHLPQTWDAWVKCYDFVPRARGTMIRLLIHNSAAVTLLFSELLDSTDLVDYCFSLYRC